MTLGSNDMYRDINFKLNTDWPTCRTCIYFDAVSCRQQSPKDMFTLQGGYESTINGQTVTQQNGPDHWCGSWRYIGLITNAEHYLGGEIKHLDFTQQVARHQSQKLEIFRKKTK